MTQIANPQGAIKLSEVAADIAQALLATGIGEDSNTVVDQIRKVLTDSLKRSGGGFLLTSRDPVALTPGNISWTSNTITFIPQTNIILKILQNESGGVVDLTATYGASNTATTFQSIALANGEILYIEIDRSLLPASGPLVLQNAVGGGSLVSGKTIKKSTAGPALVSAFSGATGTISIPLAMNIDGALWWIPHGIYWPAGVSSPLGAVVTSTSIPIGAQIPWNAFGDIQVYGYTGTKTNAPGFQLCDGSVIIDPQSPKFNPTRNPDGTPSLSYNAALDKFTPNNNGEHIAHSTLVAWTEGDYVINAGTRYVAIQNVPIGIAVTNLTYWQTEATYNNTSPVNPYNKYRKTTQNQGLNSYPRGNNQSFHGSNASGYGGENTHVLTLAESPAHSHTAASAGAHTHPGSTATSAGSHNHGGATAAASAGTFAPPGAVGYESGDDGAAAPAGAVGSSHSHGISSDGAHTHPLSLVSDGAHTHSTDSMGGGGAHNNEPRYSNSVWIIRIY